jgi:DNA adenine methylase
MLPSPVRFFGGKGALRTQIAPVIPYSRSYVEPFAGGASLFFHRQPSEIEVLNDLDCDLINLFRYLQHPVAYQTLEHRLRYTLYSRGEFGKAIEILQDADSSLEDRAWAVFVSKNQGFSGEADYESQWSRSPSAPRAVPGAFAKKVTLIKEFHERLKMVFIERQDALVCMRYWDSTETVMYVDPPYVAETRSVGHRDKYHTEMTAEDHCTLVKCLLELQGAVVLSGYSHAIYQPLEEAGWEKIEILTSANAAGRTRGSPLLGEGAAKKYVARTEVVWRNPKAVEMTKTNYELFR